MTGLAQGRKSLEPECGIATLDALAVQLLKLRRKSLEPECGIATAKITFSFIASLVGRAWSPNAGLQPEV